MPVLREPLLHFLLIGAVLFGLFRLLDDGAPSPDEIVVSQGRIEQLATSFKLVWQRDPTPEELQGLIADHVREEILYREAVAMGLDRDDTIIRRRMRQKLEFLTEDLSALLEPTDEDLQAWFDAHSEAYRIDDRFTFTQVYLSPQRRGDDLQAEAERLLRELSIADGAVDPGTLGDPILLPGSFEAMPRDRVELTFGTTFAKSLETALTGSWAGPLESGYGLHLVLVTERLPGGVPELAAVRDAVHRDWSADRRARTLDQYYESLRQRYTIRIEGRDEEEGDR